MEYNDNVIEDIIKKYKLEPSDYIVDLLSIYLIGFLPYYENIITKNNKVEPFISNKK